MDDCENLFLFPRNFISVKSTHHAAECLQQNSKSPTAFSPQPRLFKFLHGNENHSREWILHAEKVHVNLFEPCQHVCNKNRGKINLKRLMKLNVNLSQRNSSIVTKVIFETQKFSQWNLRKVDSCWPHLENCKWKHDAKHQHIQLNPTVFSIKDFIYHRALN